MPSVISARKPFSYHDFGDIPVVERKPCQSTPILVTPREISQLGAQRLFQQRAQSIRRRVTPLLFCIAFGSEGFGGVVSDQPDGCAVQAYRIAIDDVHAARIDPFYRLEGVA